MKLFSSALFKTLVRLALIVGVLSFLVRFNGASVYVSESNHPSDSERRHFAVVLMSLLTDSLHPCHFIGT